MKLYDERGQVNRVHMGHGKPGKSWNFMEGHGKL